jgi:hypothetical protein
MSTSARNELFKLLGLKVGSSLLNLPEKWNSSPFTLSYYLNKMRTFNAANNFNLIVNGTHVLLDLPLVPIRYPAVIGVAASVGPPVVLAIDAVDEETLADFNNRMVTFRWDYTNVEKRNKIFDDGVTLIIKEFQRITTEMTQSDRALNESVMQRNIIDLMHNFSNMGINSNIHVGTSAMNQLKDADFQGCTVQEIKSIMDTTIELSNKHREATSQIGNAEKMEIFLKKIVQSDQMSSVMSKRTNKFQHSANNIEQNIGGPHDYESAVQSMIDVQNLFDSKNHTSNVVDAAKQLYGIEISASNEKGHSVNATTTKCIGCHRSNHAIDTCHSHFVCAVDEKVAHHVNHICPTNPQICKVPPKKLQDWKNFQDSKDAKGHYGEVVVTTKNQKKAIAKAAKIKAAEDDKESKDYAAAVKRSLEDVNSRSVKRTRNTAFTVQDQLNENLQDIQRTLKGFSKRLDKQEEISENIQYKLSRRDSRDSRHQSRRAAEDRHSKSRNVEAGNPNDNSALTLMELKKKHEELDDERMRRGYSEDSEDL